MAAPNSLLTHLSDNHKTQMQTYLKFSRGKREQHVKEVDREFADANDGIMESVLSEEEVLTDSPPRSCWP